LRDKKGSGGDVNMENNDNQIKLFEESKVRVAWDEENENKSISGPELRAISSMQV
jgi:hypothetical protein